MVGRLFLLPRSGLPSSQAPHSGHNIRLPIRSAAFAIRVIFLCAFFSDRTAPSFLMRVRNSASGMSAYDSNVRPFNLAFAKSNPHWHLSMVHAHPNEKGSYSDFPVGEDMSIIYSPSRNIGLITALTNAPLRGLWPASNGHSTTLTTQLSGPASLGDGYRTIRSPTQRARASVTQA
jgi:hypothetical protein